MGVDTTGYVSSCRALVLTIATETELCPASPERVVLEIGTTTIGGGNVVYRVYGLGADPLAWITQTAGRDRYTWEHDGILVQCRVTAVCSSGVNAFSVYELLYRR